MPVRCITHATLARMMVTAATQIDALKGAVTLTSVTRHSMPLLIAISSLAKESRSMWRLQTCLRDPVAVTTGLTLPMLRTISSDLIC